MKKLLNLRNISIILILLLFGLSFAAAAPAVTHVRTESLINGTQLYTNVTAPYFNWTYTDVGAPTAAQTNYTIYVGLTEGANGLWNLSNQSGADVNDVYAGSTLSRGITYYVGIQVFNSSAWSPMVNGTFKFNQLPVLADVASSLSIGESETISIDASATDADSDSLTFSCNRSDLFTFDTTLGTAVWVTNFSSGGVHSIDFGVTDSMENDNQTVAITIAEGNVINYATGGSSSVGKTSTPVSEPPLTGLNKILNDISNFFSSIFDLIF